jgi:hypothetical protein
MIEFSYPTGWILLVLAIVGGAWLIARSMHMGRLAPATATSGRTPVARLIRAVAHA